MSISRVGRSMLSALSAGLFISAALSFFVVVVPPGHAQATQPQVAEASDMDELGGLSAAAMTNDSGPAGIIPVAKGFNASMGTTSQHDSSSGWSSLLTPNVPCRHHSLHSRVQCDAGHKFAARLDQRLVFLPESECRLPSESALQRRCGRAALWIHQGLQEYRHSGQASQYLCFAKRCIWRYRAVITGQCERTLA